MSSEITEHTIKSGYVIKVQNGRLDFIPRLQFFERENSVHQRSVVLRAGLQQTCLRTINLLTSKFRWFVSLREGKMSPAVLAQV